MSCGQTDIAPSALTAMSQQLHTPIYYLPYYEMEVECLDLLKKLLFTENDVVVLVGTATYGEEAAMLSALEPGDRVLTVNTGTFGQVLTDLVRVAEAEDDEIVVPGGQSVAPEQIRAALKQDPTIKMVAVVHVETSRGTTNPIAAIGQMMQEEFPDVLYLVDSVSGLGAMELRVDEWGIDLLCTSGQKAVDAPQGTALVAVSPKAWNVIENRKTQIRSLCLDLITWKRYHQATRFNKDTWYGGSDNIDASMSAYKSVHGPSQSYVLMKALKAALAEIDEEGIENVWRRHKIASRALREGMRAMGFEILSSEDNAAWDCTCVIISDDEFDVKQYMRTMWDQFGIATAGGSPNREAAGYAGFRIGCMGKPASPEYILPFLAATEQVLSKMGYPVNAGAALPAAQAIFAEA